MDRPAKDSQPDDVLLKKIASGNEAALEVLILRYTDRLRRYCRSRWRGEEDDICQEVWTRFIPRLQKGQVEDKGICAMLFTAARNLQIDRTRSRQRRPRVQSLEIDVSGPEEDDFDFERLARCVQKLKASGNKDQVTVFELKRTGADNGEMCEALSLNADDPADRQKVSKLLHAAKTFLQDCVNRGVS